MSSGRPLSERIRMPLRVSIPLSLLVFSVLLAAFSLEYYTQTTSRQVEARMVEELGGEMARLRSAAEYLLATGDLERTRQVIGGLANNPELTAAYLLDDWGEVVAGTLPRGSLLAESEPDRQDRALAAERVLTTREGYVYINAAGDRAVGFYPVALDSSDLPDQPRTGLIFMERNIRPAKAAAIRTVQRQVEVTSMLLVALAAVLWLFFHFALTRRVGKLVSAASRVAGGDLAARANVRGADEIAKLARAFNRMVYELQEGRTRLVESEARVRLLLDSAAEAIFGLDLDGRCTFSNQACVQLLEYESPDDLLGKNIHELIHHSHADGSPYPETDCHIQRALMEGAEVHVDSEVLWRADGTCFPAEYWSHPVYRDGKIDGSVVTFFDISERKKSEEALQRIRDGLENRVEERTHELVAANRRLKAEIVERERIEMALVQSKEEAESANQAKSEFLSRMSHELRTPMNAILGFAQILESDPADPLSVSQAESVREILGAGYHLLDLINEVLDLSRIESGSLSIEPQSVTAGTAISEALSLVEPMAEQFGVRLEDHSARYGRTCIVADPTRLRQVLLNLLSNGVKYNREGGTVTVMCESLPGALRIVVTDTGQGIDEKQQARLFQPFTRLTDDYSDVGGTGIGLTITKRLVELMDGAIGFSSTYGEGSRFFVDLPLSGREVEATEEEDIPRRLLYIEDNRANVELVRRILARRDDLEMLSATSAENGIAVAREMRPDVVLLDISLPDMDGYQALERLREQAETRDTPVLAFSGNSLPADVKRGLEAGFFRYLTKPADINTLLAAIDEAMGNGVVKEVPKAHEAGAS